MAVLQTYISKPHAGNDDEPMSAMLDNAIAAVSGGVFGLHLLGVLLAYV